MFKKWCLSVELGSLTGICKLVIKLRIFVILSEILIIWLFLDFLGCLVVSHILYVQQRACQVFLLILVQVINYDKFLSHNWVHLPSHNMWCVPTLHTKAVGHCPLYWKQAGENSWDQRGKWVCPSVSEIMAYESHYVTQLLFKVLFLLFVSLLYCFSH